MISILVQSIFRPGSQLYAYMYVEIHVPIKPMGRRQEKKQEKNDDSDIGDNVIMMSTKMNKKDCYLFYVTNITAANTRTDVGGQYCPCPCSVIVLLLSGFSRKIVSGVCRLSGFCLDFLCGI